jgi:hypothetical protein
MINCPFCSKNNWVRDNSYKNYTSLRYACGFCKLRSTFIDDNAFYFDKQFGKYHVEWVVGYQPQCTNISTKDRPILYKFDYILPYNLTENRIEKFLILK